MKQKIYLAKLEATMNSIFDFLWVLQAYLRGKVLRQKDYLEGENNRFHLPVLLNFKRIRMLMKWWGHSLVVNSEEERALVKKMPLWTSISLAKVSSCSTQPKTIVETLWVLKGSPMLCDYGCCDDRNEFGERVSPPPPRENVVGH